MNMMTTRRLKIILLIALLSGIFGGMPPASAQQELTREERIKVVERMQLEDRQWEDSTRVETLAGKSATELEKMELPPLSVFLDAVVENATVKRAKSQVEQVKNEYELQKRDWWNFFRINGSYSYGRYNIIGNASDEYTPMYQTSMASAQHSFNVGAGVTIPLGEFTNRKKKLKRYKYDIEQLEYTQENIMEERRLRVLEAYNDVTVQLATIRAKAESAALYNAQMKISENNFIQGKIDIITLSLERARRSGAVVSYEEARVKLHNSIILLEMLTNVQIIKD